MPFSLVGKHHYRFGNDNSVYVGRHSHRVSGEGTAHANAFFVFDMFNRANGRLGNAETGQSWTRLDGVNGTAEISSNQALFTQDALNDHTIFGIDSGESDIEVQATFVGQTGGTVFPYLIFRGVDEDNYVFFFRQSGVAHLGQFSGGTFSDLATGNAVSVGDVIKIVASGNDIEVFADGVSVLTDTISFLATATIQAIGLNGGAGATVTWDDFSVASV